MKRSLAVLLVAGLVAAAGPAAAAVAVETVPGEGPPGPTIAVPGDAASTVAYEPSDAVIANPQRGFYHHTETHFNTAKPEQNTPLTEADLAGLRSNGITQILRVVYLEDFAANPVLDERVLSQLQADYDTARAAGISVITRFAYVGKDGSATPPYGDAPLDIVLAHIKQLGPVLRANADVIPVVQNGFIGRWGEGYYTDHFLADPAHPELVTEQDWDKRAVVTRALLDELPADRGIQTRTMYMKQHVLGVPAAASSAVTPGQAFTDTPIARIGLHNDCFLTPWGDYGTFLSDPVALDEEYLAADSMYVPVGGETCEKNDRSGWETAAVELARYHYSYLNTDYNRLVLDSWGEPALTETAKRLGYRFVMESSTVTPAEDSVEVSVDIRNDGWAAPYLPRTAMLQLTGSDGATVSVPFASNADARRWLPATTTTLSTKLNMSDPALASLADGSYTLAVALPSSDAGTAADPRFAVQTANLGTWNETDGTNALSQAVVVGPRAAAPVAGDLPQADPGAVGVPVLQAQPPASNTPGVKVLAATGGGLVPSTALALAGTALLIVLLGSAVLLGRPVQRT